MRACRASSLARARRKAPSKTPLLPWGILICCTCTLELAMSLCLPRSVMHKSCALQHPNNLSQLVAGVSHVHDSATEKFHGLSAPTQTLPKWKCLLFRLTHNSYQIILWKNNTDKLNSNKEQNVSFPYYRKQIEKNRSRIFTFIPFLIIFLHKHNKK